MKRRILDLRSAAEVIEETQRLRQGYNKTGNWNLSQICQHLDRTMQGGMDGFGFRIPWILRATIVKWGFRYALKKRTIYRGFPTFSILRPNGLSATEDDDDVVDQFLETCRRADAFVGPIEEYALLNEIAVDQWKDFMWLHASHHLGFLVPDQA